MGGTVKSVSSRSKIFYVYALLDTRKPGKHRYGRWVFQYEPYYIGKGHAERVHSHKSVSPNSEITKGSTFKAKLSRKIVREGYKIESRFMKQNLTERQAFALEEQLIHRIGRRDLKEGPLTNLTYGGEGEAGAVRSVHTRNLLSRIVTEAWNLKTQEEKEEHRNRAIEGNRKRSRKKEIERRRKISERQLSRTEAEKDKIYGHRRKPKVVISEKQRAENEKRRRESIRAYQANLTDEQKAEIAKKKRKAMLKVIKARSSKEKQELRNRIKEGHKRIPLSVKKQLAKVISGKRKDYFKSLSKSEKDAWRRKISRTKMQAA